MPEQAAGLELRHRQHARVEDRIREAKATGLRNLPCHGGELNAAGSRRYTPRSTWSPGPSSSRSPTPPNWPVRDPRVPLPRAARRRPDHLRRSPDPAAHRRPMALGQPRSPRRSTNTCRVRLTARAPAPDPADPRATPPDHPSGHSHVPPALLTQKPANRISPPVDQKPHERGGLATGRVRGPTRRSFEARPRAEADASRPTGAATPTSGQVFAAVVKRDHGRLRLTPPDGLGPNL